jgi:hypothetical protein
MKAIAGAVLRRTVTSYCIVGSLAEGERPYVGEEGVFTQATTTVFVLDIIHSDSPYGCVRKLHGYNGTSNQINWRVNQSAIDSRCPQLR